MDVNSFLQLCSTIGIPSAMLIYIYFQREKDKKEQNEKMERQMGEEKKERLAMEDRFNEAHDREMTMLTNQLLEVKEEKKILYSNLNSFKESFERMSKANEKVESLTIKVDNIEDRVVDIDNKIDKIIRIN